MHRVATFARHVVAHGSPGAQPACSGITECSSDVKTVGFGIIGAGDIARQSFAPALLASTKADLVAVCRRNIAQATAFADQDGGGCTAYGDAQTLLEDPAVDAVIIATPTHTHAELAMLAAKHGKHVLVEKPMARNAQECQTMIEACKRANVSLGVCYRRRLFPQVMKAKELVAAGAIGEVMTVRTHCSALQDSLKAEREGFSEEWRAEPLLGGAMMEMASHRIEVLLNLMDRKPHGVSALVETAHPDHQHWAADDSDALLLQFDGGRIGIHSTNLTTPPRRDMAVVEGTLGRIMIDSLEFGGDQIVLETPSAGATIISVTPLEDGLFDLPMIDDFADATLAEREGGNPPTCGAHSGLVVQATIDAAFKSAASKRFVKIAF